MSRETYYWTCPYCKANLDPGESCDCRKEVQESSTTTITKQSDTEKKENK